jgi:hypothetical protein
MAVIVDRRLARMRIVRDIILRTSYVSGRGRDPLMGVGDKRHGGQGEGLLAGSRKPP